MKISDKIILVVFNLSLVVALIHGSNEKERQPYIVYMGDALDPKFGITAAEDHYNLLITAIGDKKVALESTIHSYGRSFNAFAARLLPDEAKRLKNMKGVVSVFPSTLRKLHTTRSWDFLGMPQTVKRNPKIESHIIVGLLDTGIWMKSPSFNDEGYGPPPAKWKGKCAEGVHFTGCNKKVIGARYYRLDKTLNYTEPMTPADTEGHGTHTSSTAAGVSVNGANLYDLAKGTARGGVPSARIAMYKVCWNNGCTDVDLLAAFDDAIADGVDLISLSIGGMVKNYFEDSIAIGSFHAIRKGILTSASAGNDGPYPMTVVNVAPWMLTVAASGLDRQFRTEFRLGNGKKSDGISVNTFSLEKKMYPLINGAHAVNKSTSGNFGYASSCDYGTLDKNKVKGKIVYCLPGYGSQDYTVKDSGGVGTIVRYDQQLDTGFTLVVPGTFVNITVGDMVDRYINSTRNAQGIVYKSKTVNVSAPFVASFSSRGPNTLSLNILKPDIAAPGVDILAAYSPLSSVTGLDIDNRFVNYNIISGTSMACPHVAAAAAYVKSFHHKWSPAAIKSALMTTATNLKVKQTDAEFAYGSGQVNPVRAVHPGLIYDMNRSSYISFLCREGYNSTDLSRINGGHLWNCSSFPRAQGSDGLNYPSMQFQVASAGERISAVFERTVTNVGKGKSVYKVKIASPKGLSISVIPNTMTFDRPYVKKSFKVVVKGMPLGETSHLSASIIWSDSRHTVRSPIIVYQPLSQD